MAHHLAGLIVEARESKGPDRRRAENAAANLILRIWAQREHLPGRTYPLKEWGRSLSVLQLLEAEASPFSRASAQAFDRRLAETFDRLRQIVARGIVLTLSDPQERDASEEVTKFLDEEEQRYLTAIHGWLDHFSKNARGILSSKPKAGKDDRGDGRSEGLIDRAAHLEALVSDIDNLVVALSKFREEAERQTGGGAG